MTRPVHKLAAAAAIGVGIALLGATIVSPPRPRLVWNASPSAPVGLYSVERDGRINVGDMVIAHVPASYGALASDRHYVPANVPLVKRVAATSGSQVCALGKELFLDGGWLADRRATDGQGRRMPWWHGCVRLAPNQLLLLMPGKQASFDGRYFGVSERSDIIGKAHLLWAR
jgi:conjugative transfer signal peptidase TraF